MDREAIDRRIATENRRNISVSQRRRSDPQYAQKLREVVKKSQMRLAIRQQQEHRERAMSDVQTDSSSMGSPETFSETREQVKTEAGPVALLSPADKAARRRRKPANTSNGDSGSSDSTLPDYPNKVTRTQFQAPRRRGRAADTPRLKESSESSNDGDLPLRLGRNAYVALDHVCVVQAALIGFPLVRDSNKHHRMVARKSSRPVRRVVQISSSEDESMRVVA